MLVLAGADAEEPKAKADKVPPSLVDVGEFGENVYDLVKAGEWAKANDKFKALEGAAKKFKAVEGAKVEKKFLADTLVALGKALAAKEKLAVLRAANRVTRIAADASEPFEPKIPAAVTRLDVFGRELEIATMGKDLDQAKAAAKGLRKNWDKIGPAVKARGGEAEAKRFESLLTKVEAAKSVEDYGKLVTPILDEVDNLEKVFTK